MKYEQVLKSFTGDEFEDFIEPECVFSTEHILQMEAISRMVWISTKARTKIVEDINESKLFNLLACDTIA
jgi:hypothetical protein